MPQKQFKLLPPNFKLAVSNNGFFFIGKMMRLLNANFSVAGVLHCEEAYFNGRFDFERDILSRFPNATCISIVLVCYRII